MSVSYMIIAVRGALSPRSVWPLPVRYVVGVLVALGMLIGASHAQQPLPDGSAGEVVFVAGAATRQAANAASQPIAKGLKAVGSVAHNQQDN